MLARRLLGGRGARWLLRVGVSLGIVAYILVTVDRRAMVERLAGAQPAWLAAAVAIYVSGQMLSAWKWALLGNAVGFARPYADYGRFYFIGMFFNLFGPSTIGGDLVRALYLGEGRRPGLAINSVLFDRVSGLALLMALGAVALMAFPEYGLPPVLETGIAAGGLLLVAGWWTCPRLIRLLPDHNRLRRQVENELGPFWRDRRLLAVAAAVSLVFHLTQVVVQWIVARAVGAEVPFSYCLIYHPLVSVMTALPFSIAGFGVREGGYLYFLGAIDVDDSIAVAIGLLWFAVSAVSGLVGGVLFLASGAELPRLRTKAAASAGGAAA
jgi:glycosyltransferase 2 family protein